MRQKGNTPDLFLLLNHQKCAVRIQFYKPMHDFLSAATIAGNYDLPPHGVLVLDDHVTPGVGNASTGRSASGAVKSSGLNLAGRVRRSATSLPLHLFRRRDELEKMRTGTRNTFSMADNSQAISASSNSARPHGRMVASSAS